MIKIINTKLWRDRYFMTDLIKILLQTDWENNKDCLGKDEILGKKPVKIYNKIFKVNQIT